MDNQNNQNQFNKSQFIINDLTQKLSQAEQAETMARAEAIEQNQLVQHLQEQVSKLEQELAELKAPDAATDESEVSE